MTAPDIAAIESRLAAATPGPWQLDGPFWWRGGDVDPDSASMITASPERGAVCVMPERADRTNYVSADAELIAHAPTDLAALLAEVKRLRERESANLRCIELAIGRAERMAAISPSFTPAEAYREGLCDALNYARGYR